MPQEQSADMLSRIQAISFDLDDTLWDCAPAIRNAEKTLYEWHKEKTPAITKVHSPESLLEYRKQVRLEYPELTRCVTAIRMQGLKKLLVEFGYPEGWADEAFAVFYKARSEVVLYEGVTEMLDRLNQTFRLAAITNGNADLQSIGIEKHFERIYAANLTLLEKPAPDMFIQCLADMNISADALLHIGDNPVTDVHGAAAVGVQTLWFNPYNQAWPEHLEPANYEVQAIPDVVALFQQ